MEGSTMAYPDKHDYHREVIGYEILLILSIVTPIAIFVFLVLLWI
jgi:hypothetical protein